MNTALGDPLGMPSKTHNVGLEKRLTWVKTVIEDLHQRACALEQLVDSSLRVCTEDGSTASDGPPAATVRVDRRAWFIAVDAATAPRPRFPSSPPG